MINAVELAAQAALMAVVALGAWTAMDEGMILNWIARFAGRMPAWIAKPLATCPRCMCSVWGIAVLIVCGFGVGVSINLEPDPGLLAFDEAMQLVAMPAPSRIAIDWSRIVEVPFLILTAIGIQELFHRP